MAFPSIAWEPPTAPSWFSRNEATQWLDGGVVGEVAGADDVGARARKEVARRPGHGIRRDVSHARWSSRRAARSLPEGLQGGSRGLSGARAEQPQLRRDQGREACL